MLETTTLKYSLGFKLPKRLFSDHQFVLALGAGCCLSFLAGGLAGEHAKFDTGWLSLVLLVFGAPLLEEIVFRGVIQGYFGVNNAVHTQYLAGLSSANLLTALLFMTSQLLYNTDLFAWLAFFPALVFGYFRERHDSLLPGVILHSAFNSALISGWYLGT